MTYLQFDPAMQGRTACNAGKTVGIKRPLNQKQIWASRFFLDREEHLRDRARFDLAIDSKLSSCDLVKLKIVVLVAGTDIRTLNAGMDSAPGSWRRTRPPGVGAKCGPTVCGRTLPARSCVRGLVA